MTLARSYSWPDRLDQLRRIADSSRQLAELLVDEPRAHSPEYARLARAAAQVSQAPVSHDELKEVARLLPPRPTWLDPRNNAGWGDRPDWMMQVSTERNRLDKAVLELRALGEL